MNLMTPEEARALLDGTTPGPWRKDPLRSLDGVNRIYAVVSHGEVAGVRTVADEIYDDADATLIAAAPVLAAMRAEMHEDWGVEVTHYRDGDLHTRWGYDDRKDAAAFAHYMGRDPRWNAARVVRRYVTTPEEA